MDKEAVKTAGNWLFDRRCAVDNIQRALYELKLRLIEEIKLKIAVTLVVYTTFDLVLVTDILEISTDSYYKDI